MADVRIIYGVTNDHTLADRLLVLKYNLVGEELALKEWIKDNSTLLMSRIEDARYKG